MKKLTLAVLVAATVIGLGSCGKSTPKADLKNEIDTVSYAYGIACTTGLEAYLVRNLGMDTTYMAEFVKGLNEGVNAGEDKKRIAYYAGIQIGQQLTNQMTKGINYQLFGEDSTQTISMKNFMAGFITAATKGKGIFTMDQAQQLIEVKSKDIKAKALEKQYGANKKAGEDYMAKYAKGKDVKKLPGGVLYKVIKEGKGDLPSDTSLVTMQYEGKLIDGTVFDSSYKRNEPAKMRVRQVVPGFSEALKNMPEGSVWEVVIPQDKAYGVNGQGQIKPFSALVFKIELLKANR